MAIFLYGKIYFGSIIGLSKTSAFIYLAKKSTPTVIEFVDQLIEMKTRTNKIFKNGVKQLQMLRSVLKNLYQTLRTSLIKMGHH